MVVLVGWWCLPAEVSVADAVAVAFEGNNFGVVDEPVDHFGGDRLGQPRPTRLVPSPAKPDCSMPLQSADVRKPESPQIWLRRVVRVKVGKTAVVARALETG
jgi:hypothetical protein